MKKLIYLVSIIFIFSCKKEVKEIYQEYNGQRVKIEFGGRSNDSLFTGHEGSSYENGNLKTLGYYKNGVLIDTLFVYHKNGRIKEKGLLKNNLKNGWWLSYDEQGNLLAKMEILNFGDTLYKNQSYFYEKNGDIKMEPSTFFEIEISDTLKLGKNAARIKNYITNFNNSERNLLSVILENKKSENEIRKDTFSDGTLTPYFGITTYKLGKQKIKVKIEEKIVTKTKDSSGLYNLTIADHYKYFEKEVYVQEMETELGKRLREEMITEYKNN